MTGPAALAADSSHVVLVHGLFVDGSCWSEVIARLQATGMNLHGGAKSVDHTASAGGADAARRGAGSRCGRGRHGAGGAIPDAADRRRHRPVRRLWAAERGAFLRDFAGDLPPAKARVLYAVQASFKRGLTDAKTTHAAWRLKPSWYAVSKEDQAINPDLERFMARRTGATAIEVMASHLSLISQPDTITKMILAQR